MGQFGFPSMFDIFYVEEVCTCLNNALTLVCIEGGGRMKEEGICSKKDVGGGEERGGV